MEFSELAFKLFYTPENRVYDCIAWAEHLLGNGCDFLCVAELASCGLESVPDESEVERLFDNCLAELNLKLPDNWNQALIEHLVSKCEQFLSSDLEPLRFLTDILLLSNELDDPEILWIWIDLAGDISFKCDSLIVCVEPTTFNNRLDLKDADKCIRQTALQFLSLCSIELPPLFPLVWWCQNCGAISEEPITNEVFQCDCLSSSSAQSMKNMRYFENRELFILKLRAAK
jgi:hypothetical protein